MHPLDEVTGKIVIFSLGGTIASVPGAEPGVAPQQTGADLIAAVPALAGMPLVPVAFRQKPGSHLTFDDIDSLAHAIDAVCSAGARGIVVTQGTDTIEEVAFALDLLLETKRPVVVTGAMRNPLLAGADGPANLLAAVQLADCDSACGMGVLVAFHDEIHAARFVSKSHTTSPSAFVSRNAGKVGWMSEGRVVLTVGLPRMPKVTRRGVKRNVVVPLVTMTIGFEPALLEALGGLRPDALVVNAFGGGHVVPEAVEMLEDAAARCPILLSSRTNAGRVLCGTYGYPGGEIDLLRRGILDAGWLDACKARILAAMILRNGGTGAELRASLSFFSGSAGAADAEQRDLAT